jgi:hypothetical protein
LVSRQCSADGVANVIRGLVAEMGDARDVHWVVQNWLRPTRKGHVSNERRVAYEPRDWLLEVERQGEQPGYVSAVAVRTWRDGSVPGGGPLRCATETQVGLVLKNVAIYAIGLGKRMHFEWVWSGGRVWVVQGDVAESADGIDPTTLRPQQIQTMSATALSTFREASPDDFEKYGKLRNARLYRELGYDMPAFYVLDSPTVIAAILAGDIDASVAEDLNVLTQRPLIVRTDGSSIPESKREMLPRSDELRSTVDARRWLHDVFATKIAEAGIQSSGLCLIAHHFLPSIASAWARAEPKRRYVRIESLWGLPEGLYWYSHDTFEVDVDSKTFAERLRYKGTFVAADEDGRWVPLRTKAPFDWRRSVRLQAWIIEIARTTRAIADHEGIPVSVMWFIDNDSRVTDHRVLPWFHSRSDLSSQPKAAPRRKVTSSRDQRVETRADWERVREQVQSGQPAPWRSSWHDSAAG